MYMGDYHKNDAKGTGCWSTDEIQLVKNMVQEQAFVNTAKSISVPQKSRNFSEPLKEAS